MLCIAERTKVDICVYKNDVGLLYRLEQGLMAVSVAT